MPAKINFLLACSYTDVSAHSPSREAFRDGEERRGTAVFAGSITNRCSGNAPALLSRTGCY